MAASRPQWRLALNSNLCGGHSHAGAENLAPYRPESYVRFGPPQYEKAGNTVQLLQERDAMSELIHAVHADQVGTAQPRIAVIIPVYRQPQFLIESAYSVLNQTLSGVVAVIVNDGCPYVSSHRLASSLAALHPDRIHYIYQRNRGLAAARNRGIRYALARWPDIAAVFPLDCDNVLDPEALEKLYAILLQNRGAGWVYPYLERFGASTAIWCNASSPTITRMLFENQCDAGSLISRRVFESSIYYDETMKEGYEDWEFFLRALEHGFRGISAGTVGFRYRTRRASMLTEAAAKHEKLVRQLHARHRSVVEPRRRTELENVELPRFMFLDIETGRKLMFTDPEHACDQSEHRDLSEYIPPYSIVGSWSAFKAIKTIGLGPGLLMFVQHAAQLRNVKISLKGGERPVAVRTYHRKRDDTAFVLFCGDTQRLTKKRRLKRFPTMVIEIASCSFKRTSNHHFRIRDVAAAACRCGIHQHIEQECRGESVSTGPARQKIMQRPARVFMRDLHSDLSRSTFPIGPSAGNDILIAAPWIKLGGVDQCIVKLSGAIRELEPTCRLHLLLSEQGDVEIPSVLDQRLFDTITPLGGLGRPSKAQIAATMMRSMDLVINAHSLVGYDAAAPKCESGPELSLPPTISYLHVYDLDRGGCPVGFPFIAADLEPFITKYAVISEKMKYLLINSGVPPEKVFLARNAPVVSPGLKRGMGLAAEKAARINSGEPLRLLYAGRLDYQKGGARLSRITHLLSAVGLNFNLKVVGKATGGFRHEFVDLPPGIAKFHPPEYDYDRLAEYYSEADVLLLPSRWEGVPLAMLDAMAHGCIVIATDVGAVGEVLESGRNGYLIPNGEDGAVAERAARRIIEVAGSGGDTRKLREAAVKTAAAYSWQDTAKQILRAGGIHGVN